MAARSCGAACISRGSPTLLRRARFRRVWILDRTVRPALAATLARIPAAHRARDWGRSAGSSPMPGIDRRHFHDLPIDWLRALMAAMDVPLAHHRAEPQPARRIAGGGRRALSRGAASLDRARARRLAPDEGLADRALEDVRRRAAPANRRKRVPDRRPAACRTRSRARAPVRSAPWRSTPATLRSPRPRACCALPICSSGRIPAPMNLAAAGETPAFALFGTTPVLRYSRFIHPIEPDGGQAPDGMTRIRRNLSSRGSSLISRIPRRMPRRPARSRSQATESSIEIRRRRGARAGSPGAVYRRVAPIVLDLAERITERHAATSLKAR